jgi:hypothetical protein
MQVDAVSDSRVDGPLLDPSDPTGRQEIARNRDEIEAMLYLSVIDTRLPRIVYLRKKGKTLRTIASACGCAPSTVNNLLKNCTPNLLRECGLRKI